MVLTLKVISCAINYQDGLLKDEDLREAQKKNRLLKMPSLIEYLDRAKNVDIIGVELAKSVVQTLWSSMRT